MSNYDRATIIQILILVGALLAIYFWALPASKVYEFETKKEPVVYAHKIPPTNTQTLGSLVGGPDKTFNAWLTAYNPTRAQCDATPLITASGKKVHSRTMACPKWIPFGTKVEVEGLDLIRICEDRMHPKHSHRFDLLFWSKNRARNWGKRYKQIKLYYPK